MVWYGIVGFNVPIDTAREYGGSLVVTVLVTSHRLYEPGWVTANIPATLAANLA